MSVCQPALTKQFDFSVHRSGALVVTLQAFQFPERRLHFGLRAVSKPGEKGLFLIRGMVRGSLVKITQRLFQAALFIFRERPIL